MYLLFNRCKSDKPQWPESKLHSPRTGVSMWPHDTKLEKLKAQDQIRLSPLPTGYTVTLSIWVTILLTFLPSSHLQLWFWHYTAWSRGSGPENSKDHFLWGTSFHPKTTVESQPCRSHSLVLILQSEDEHTLNRLAHLCTASWAHLLPEICTVRMPH